MSRFAAPSGLLALALLLGKTGVGSATEPNTCGFVSSEARVQAYLAGVPVIMEASALPVGKQQRVLERRERLLHGRASMVGRCKKTQSYLQGILNRVVTGAGLDRLPKLTPPIELVLECDASVPVPVARAMAGNVLLVPRALPLLASSEDALVAVLTHELAHFSLRHFERLSIARSEAGTSFASNEVKMAHEREADITGLRLLVSAGYDPRAALDHLLALSALHGPGRRRPRRRIHDATPTRVALLRTQIESCAYASPGQRTPIPPEVRAELTESVASFAAALPAPRP